jgi:hypothetical protein
MSFQFLQVLWFILIAVIILGWATMDGFDYGVGGLLAFIAKDDREKKNRNKFYRSGMGWKSSMAYFRRGCDFRSFSAGLRFGIQRLLSCNDACCMVNNIQSGFI